MAILDRFAAIFFNSKEAHAKYNSYCCCGECLNSFYYGKIPLADQAVLATDEGTKVYRLAKFT